MADNSLRDLTAAVYRIAENSPKIQKDVKDIRDAICGANGILSALLSIAENVANVQKNTITDAIVGKNRGGGDFAKPNKELVKNTDNMVDILKKMLDQMKKGGLGSGGGGVTTKGLDVSNFKNNKEIGKQMGGITTAISLVGSLKDIKLKDFLFANIKLKALKSLMSKAIKISKTFKDNKEIDDTVNFVNASIKVAKTLSLISKIQKPAEKGAEAIEKILIGDRKKGGGLLKVFHKMLLHKKAIEDGKNGAKRLQAACGSFLITALCLTVIAILSIPAIIGAVALKFIIPLLVGAFKLLGKSTSHIIKGSVAMLILSASIIAFSLGLLIMTKAVEKMSFASVGIFLAAVVGIGLAIFGIGLAVGYILPGVAAMLLLSFALGVFSLTLLLWKNIDAKKAMKNIDIAVGGLRETFGLELGKGDESKSIGDRLTGGLMDIAMAVLNFGKTFFIMGSILLAGAALGLLYVGLKPWQNFNGQKAAANIKDTVIALKDAFGLNDSSGDIASAGSKLAGGILDIGMSLLQMGKTFITLGTLVVATAMMDIIRLTLIPWENYDGTKSAANMKTAIGALKETFGLDKETSAVGKIGSILGGPLDIAMSLLQMGKTFITMGTLVMATAMMDLIRLGLMPWENYDGKKAAGNMKIAVDALKHTFGLDDKPESIGGKLGALGSGMLDMALAMLQMRSTFITMGTLLMATLVMDIIRLNLMPWENYDGKKAAGNMKIAVDALKHTFGLDDKPESIGGKLGALGGETLDIALAILQMGKTYVVMGTLLMATAVMGLIRLGLMPWENYDGKKAAGNMKIAVDALKHTFGLDDKPESVGGKISSLGGQILDIGISLLQMRSTFITMGTLVMATALMDIIRVTLLPWERYNGKKAAGNMKIAVDALKETFGLKEKSTVEKIGTIFGGAGLELGMSLLQMGKTFITMGTLVVATALMDIIRVALLPWESYNGKKAAGNMKIAVDALKETFGLKEKSTVEKIGSFAFGGGTLDIAMSLLQMGKTFITMGTLVMATAMMDIIRVTLLPWESYNGKKAAGNMKIAVDALKETFGITEKSTVEKIGAALGGGPLELGISLLQMGKTFITMGTLVMATALMDIIRATLLPWERYNGKKAAGNMKIAVDALKETFGLKEKSTVEKIGSFALGRGPLELGMSILQMGKTYIMMGTLVMATAIMNIIRLNLLSWESYNGVKAAGNMKLAVDSLKSAFNLEEKSDLEKIGSFALGGGPLELGISLLQMGKTFIMMGTLVVASTMMDIIRVTLLPWENYNGKKAADNMKNALGGLKSAFGIDDKPSEIGVLGDIIGNQLNLFSLGQTLIQAGKVFVQIGTILIATATMERIKKNLTEWDNYDPSAPITNIDNTIRGLKRVFGLVQDTAESGEETENKSAWSKIGNFFKKAADAVTTPIKVASNMLGAAENLSEGGKMFASLNNLIRGTGIMLNIMGSIKPWDDYTPDGALSNMTSAITSLNTVLFKMNVLNFNNGKLKNLPKMMNTAKSLFLTMSKTRIMSRFSSSVISSARAVNSINLDKAIVLRDIFTAFSSINKYNTFDKFTQSVDKFVEACDEMVEALDNFDNKNPFFEKPIQNQDVQNTSTNKNGSGEISSNNLNDITNAIVNAIRQISLTANVDASFNVGYMDGDKIVIRIDN